MTTPPPYPIPAAAAAAEAAAEAEEDSSTREPADESDVEADKARTGANSDETPLTPAEEVTRDSDDA
ncbi:MAG TPA: hypothetical protein VGJ53_06195 [Micromonosporaceae bacterium]|jgi:hypothetical protein